MKKFLFFSLLSLLFGCQNLSSQIPDRISLAQASQEYQGCPEQPNGVLENANVRAISLAEEPISESVLIQKGQFQGLAFEGRKGQNFNYRQNKDLCIWVFTPNNELVESTNLPATGRYLIQISAPKGSGTFELEMSLGSQRDFSSDRIKNRSDDLSSSKLKTHSKKSSLSSTRSLFSSEDFPKFVCGDSKPSDPDVYPVNFYPVKVPFSEANLATSQEYFCRDAFAKRDKNTGETVVQIASFLSESKAREFANLVQSKMPEATVGAPTVVYD